MPTPDPHKRLQTLSLLVIAAVAGGFALVWLGGMLIPFVLAFFLAVALEPVVRLLARRLRVPIPVAFVVSSLLGLGILVGFGALVASSVSELSANKEAYVTKVNGLVELVETSPRLEFLHVDDWKANESFKQSAQTAAGDVLGKLGDVLGKLASQGFLVLIFVMFMMAGIAKGSAGNRTLGDVRRRIRGYVRTKMMVSALTGAGVWVCLSVLGVEMALVFGLFAFLLNFIPNVGSLVATLLPLPIVMLGPYGLPTQIMAIVLPGALQFAVGNWIEPRLLGDSMDLHPVTILLALIFWGMVWGMVGALLATPLTAIARILLEKEPLTRPLAELMAGRLPPPGGSQTPPTPAEP